MSVLGDLDRSGYTTSELLPAEVVADLQDLLVGLGVEDRHGFFASSNDLDGEAAAAIAQRIVELVSPHLARLLPGHEPFLASFLTKGHERGSAVSFHQDLTYTDERHDRTVVAWIPLCDVDARNGAMAVLPGSHLWTDGCRPGGPRPLPTEAFQEELAGLARVVPLRAGEALLYDAALAHGSGPNPTAEGRPAVGVALAPRDAGLVHVHVDDDGGLTAWSVDADYYTHQSLWSRPEGYPATEVWGPPVDEDALSAALRRAAQDGDADGRDGARQVLVDPEADEALRRDGFAVIDLPQAAELAAELSNFYAREHGLGGSGFEPDLVNPDLDYRRGVSDRLSADFDAMASDLFIDYDPFLRVFLAKWPGPQSDLYLHRDWMYVDERTSGHTYVVWIPLCHVDERNGPLQVLRGSHLIDDSPRGTNLNAPWINHHDVVVPRLEAVTAQLGQAVVLDNALVHSSLPNESDDLRLVAAVGMRPSGAQLIHFLRADDETAWRFDIDESFLMTSTPQGLLAEPPDLPVVERLAAGQRFWDEAELLVALGEPLATSAPIPSPHHPTDGATGMPDPWWRRLQRWRRSG